MGEFPLALVPGFVVPLFIVTHIIIYLQLSHKCINGVGVDLVS
jgi:hypothetical protein